MTEPISILVSRLDLSEKTVGEVILLGQTLAGLAAGGAGHGGAVENRTIGHCVVSGGDNVKIEIGDKVVRI
jgi:hypothetical protein